MTPNDASAAGFEIRVARREDLDTIHSMIRELAEYEKLAHLCVGTSADLDAALFGPRPAAEVLIAWKAGRPAAFALFLPQLLDVSRPPRAVARGSVRPPRIPPPGVRARAAPETRRHRPGARLRPLRMGGARLERARRSSSTSRSAPTVLPDWRICAGRRRCAGRARRGRGPRRPSPPGRSDTARPVVYNSPLLRAPAILARASTGLRDPNARRRPLHPRPTSPRSPPAADFWSLRLVDETSESFAVRKNVALPLCGAHRPRRDGHASTPTAATATPRPATRRRAGLARGARARGSLGARDREVRAARLAHAAAPGGARRIRVAVARRAGRRRAATGSTC